MISDHIESPLSATHQTSLKLVSCLSIKLITLSSLSTRARLLGASSEFDDGLLTSKFHEICKVIDELIYIIFSVMYNCCAYNVQDESRHLDEVLREFVAAQLSHLVPSRRVISYLHLGNCAQFLHGLCPTLMHGHLKGTEIVAMQLRIKCV